MSPPITFTDCQRHEAKIEALDVRVRSLELWQAKIGGVVLVTAIVGSMIGPMVIRLLSGAHQ